MNTCVVPEGVGPEKSLREFCRLEIKATYFTARLIALVLGLLFNAFPHETDVSARAIKEF
jgi:hypothetical protein